MKKGVRRNVWDTCPAMQTAGIATIYKPDEGTAQCLHDISLQEVVESVLRSIERPKPKEYIPPKITKPIKNINNLGPNTQVAQVLKTPKKDYFQNLKDELQETAYKSYWMNELGCVPDQVANLPVGMGIEDTLFGKPSDKPGTWRARDLVNPRKCPHIVEQESCKGSELYKKSHNSFLPGEQKKHDPSLKFPPSLIFGKVTPKNYNGESAREILKWIDQSEVSTTSQSLAFFRFKNHAELGKSIKRIGIPKKYEELCYTFGKPTKYDDPVKSDVFDLAVQVAYVYHMKTALRKRHFNFTPLLTALRERDFEEKKTLDADVFYEICKKNALGFDRIKVDHICKILGVFDEEKNLINYEGFLKIIHPYEDIPRFHKVSAPPEDMTYQTEYMVMCDDLNFRHEIDCIEPAGFSNNGKTRVPRGMCSANLEDLPGETRVEELLNPDVFMTYGINHHDFFEPRSREFLKTLFSKVGIDIPNDIFDMMWQEGVRRDGTGQACIETFCNMLDEISTAKLEQLTPLRRCSFIALEETYEKQRINKINRN